MLAKACTPAKMCLRRIHAPIVQSDRLVAICHIQAELDSMLMRPQARDAAEAADKEAKSDLRGRMAERVAAWQAGKRDNIRALLSTLHMVSPQAFEVQPF